MSKAPSPKTDRLRELREARHAAKASVNNTTAVINKASGEKILEGLKEAVEIAQGKREPARVVTAKIRQAKWREENMETNRQRAREGMRKARAKAKQ